MESINKLTVTNLLADLGINTDHQSHGLQAMAAVDSKALKDLKLNVSAVLNGQHINMKQSILLALAVAINEKHQILTASFKAMAQTEGASDIEIAETFACTSVMSANNVLYRFRHYMHETDFYNNQPAGMRMSVMMNPTLGKEFFELMSLAVSALNGCERCVTSHEASVKQHGASEARIFDAVRIASVIRSLCVIV